MKIFGHSNHLKLKKSQVMGFFTRKTRASRPPALKPLTSCFASSAPNHSTFKLFVSKWDFHPSHFMFIWFEISIWDPKRIQMKKLSTTKFYNFSRSTTFILIVSPSEVVYKIWISNLRNSNVVFLDKMNSNKKSCQIQSSITFWDL